MQKFYAILVDGTIYSRAFHCVDGTDADLRRYENLNIAHGSFYAIGAYTAASAVGAYFAGHYPAAGSFLLLILAGIAVGATVGLAVERGLLETHVRPDEISCRRSSPMPHFWCSRT